MARKILIVDDNDTVRTLLKMSLKNDNYVILEAIDGLAALEIAKLEKPDLIISDIIMPNMDGFEFCRTLREQTDLSTVPFIFLTSLTESSTELRGYRTGADDYLVKSNLKRPELIAKVERMLERGQEYKKVESVIGEGMVGKLSELSFVEIIQLLGINKKTGVLRVSKDEELAQLFFREGQIVHLDFQGAGHLEVLNELSMWNSGIYKFDPQLPEIEQTITKPTMDIIMDCCRYIDEQKNL